LTTCVARGNGEAGASRQTDTPPGAITTHRFTIIWKAMECEIGDRWKTVVLHRFRYNIGSGFAIRRQTEYSHALRYAVTPVPVRNLDNAGALGELFHQRVGRRPIGRVKIGIPLVQEIDRGVGMLDDLFQRSQLTFA
jgi:hypothetical protein